MYLDVKKNLTEDDWYIPISQSIYLAVFSGAEDRGSKLSTFIRSCVPGALKI